MSDIKVGEVAHLRTTGEPVFVLDVEYDSNAGTAGGLSGNMVQVRRPHGSDTIPITHTTERFHVEELISDAEFERKRNANMRSMFLGSNASDLEPEGAPEAGTSKLVN